VDLSDADDIVKVSKHVREEYGNPSVVILNAGIANPYTILNMPDSVLQKVFAVNTFSHYRIVREFLPAITAANHGMIVTTASLAAFVTPPGLVEYAASKAAAVSFHEGLSAELLYRYNAPKVRTICVCPNFARTKLAHDFVNASNFLNPTLFPETVAEAVFEKIMSGDSGLITIPKAASWVAITVRSWSYWMQKLIITRGTKDTMASFAQRTAP
jgi:all-trans-retinol dehydrogenase (NAD+)